MKDKIIEMLGRGVPSTAVASAVGCDPSYISQLMADEEVSLRVQQLRAEHFSEYVELDKNIDDAETAALQRLQSLVPFITKPTEAARVFSILNSAKRRTSDESKAPSAPAQTVVIDLPAAARVAVTMTIDKQVIEVQGRSMATMPAKSLAAQLEQRNANRLLNAQVPNQLLMNGSQQQIAEAVLRTSKATTPLVEQL